jgi:hypothetical protein
MIRARTRIEQVDDAAQHAGLAVAAIFVVVTSHSSVSCHVGGGLVGSAAIRNGRVIRHGAESEARRTDPVPPFLPPLPSRPSAVVPASLPLDSIGRGVNVSRKARCVVGEPENGKDWARAKKKADACSREREGYMLSRKITLAIGVAGSVFVGRWRGRWWSQQVGRSQDETRADQNRGQQRLPQSDGWRW